MDCSIEIARESGEGDGIGFRDGKAVFVPGALTGERVRVREASARKNTVRAELIDILQPSADRRTPPCPWYGKCGGCSMQHMEYRRALTQKRARVSDCLGRIGGFAPGSYALAEPVGMEHPFHYRNKAVAPAGGASIGFYRANSREIVPVADCLLQHTSFAAALAATRTFLEEGGGAKSLLFRVSSRGGIMAALNTQGGTFPGKESWVRAIRELPALECALHGQNAGKDGLGTTFRTLWGESALRDDWLGIHARVSPQSFRQVNYTQAEKLYEIALSLANLHGDERVVDAYCGAGVLTQLLADRCAQAVGIEIAPSAIAEAADAARQAGRTNVRFLQGSCEELLQGLRCDLLVLDPPRRGVDAKALAAALDARPASILYISCDPATLARDAKILAGGGYRLETVAPVDMFPWTAHVETIMLLRRQDM